MFCGQNIKRNHFGSFCSFLAVVCFTSVTVSAKEVLIREFEKTMAGEWAQNLDLVVRMRLKRWT